MEEIVTIKDIELQVNEYLFNARNKTNKETRLIDLKIMLEREYENFITYLSKKYVLKDTDNQDFPHSHELYKLALIYFDKDKLASFSLIFILYTKLRRGKFYDKTNVLLISNLYNNLKKSDMLRDSDLFKHLELMAKSHYNLDQNLIKETEQLYYLHRNHYGIANHFVSVVADYYSLHLDDTIVGIKYKKKSKFKKKENSEKDTEILFEDKLNKSNEPPFIFRQILLDAEKTANEIVEKEPYEKFYFNLGRIQMLVGKFDDANKNINTAISLVSNDDERKARVATYNDYLRDIVATKAYYDTRLELIKNRLLEEDISNEKIINVGYISIFSAIVSFIAATVTSFSELSDYRNIALTITLMVLAYSCIISIVMIFMLVASKKGFKSHWLSYLIAMVVFAGTFAGFLSILLLNI